MSAVRWGGRTNPALRRWMVAGVLLLVAGLAMHRFGGRAWDLPWLLVTIVAAVVIVVGYYRHQPER